MDSLYFRDPNGSLIELAAYKFQTPSGKTSSEVLAMAYRIRVEAGDVNITEKHLEQAVRS